MEKKKGRQRRNGRRNDNKESSAVLMKGEVKESDVKEDPQSQTEAEADTDILGETVSEDTFDDRAESVDLFLDWTTVSQLIKHFGNPTVYPIKGS